MKKSNVIDLSRREETADLLTDLIRQGARQLIEQAIETELAVFMDALSGRKLSDGRAAVVRNGYFGATLEWRTAGGCPNHAWMGEDDDLERGKTHRQTLPQSLWKRAVPDEARYAESRSLFGMQPFITKMGYFR